MAYVKTVWENNPSVDTPLNADNMNNIETGILELQQGWSYANETWTYASATTITVPAGAVSKYKKGDKIKLTQTTVKYFYIIGVADTLLTITGGSGYTLTNATISANYYSHNLNPIGFPAYFNYVPTPSGLTIGDGTMSAIFTVVDGIVNVAIQFNLGSTSAVTGNITLSPPITAIKDAFNLTYFIDSSSSTYVGLSAITSNTISLSENKVDGTYSQRVNTSATVPFTWTSTDLFKISMSYFY